MNIKKFFSLAKAAFARWREDYAPSMGAALAYYTMFSIAPLLLIVISIAGFFFGQDVIRQEVFNQLQGLMGESGVHAIEQLMQSTSHPAKSAVSTAIGAVLLFIGASTVFGELQDDLDRIWRAPARVRSSGWWSLLRSRVLSFGMILGIGFLLLVSLVMSAALAAFNKWWAPLFGGWEILASLSNFIISFIVTMIMFALIYKIMPRVKIQWRDVWAGAFATALLFNLGKYLIGLYIGKSGVASGYGTAGSLVALLLWIYYSAQIFLLGAEFTRVYAESRGTAQTGDTLDDATGAPATVSGKGTAKA